jgi:hypothetical protein
MLLNRDAGEYWLYPVFGLALLHHKTKAIMQLVSQVQQGRFAGQRCYAIAYGGVQWWIGAYSHRNSELEGICLQTNGRIPVATIPWNELGLIRSASKILRDART